MRRGISPDSVSLAGVVAAAAAGGALGLVPPGLLCAGLVGVALAARLGCANLDGALARETGRTSPRGVVVGELTDRAADLVALAGLIALVPAAWVALGGLAACLPTIVSLAGASAGAPRLQGGPVGKTERCLLLVAVAAGAPALAVLVVLVVGSLVTAGLRARALGRSL